MQSPDAALTPDFQKFARHFILFQLALSLVGLIWRPYLDIWDGRLEIALHMLALSLLYGYLRAGWLQRRLGRWYINLIFLLFIVEWPLVQTLSLSLRPPEPNLLPQIVTLQATWFAAMQLIPVILIAWQRGLRLVLAFGVATLSMSFVVSGVNFGFAALITAPYVQSMFFHMFIFVSVGYVVDHLARMEREQGQALQRANQRLSELAGTLEELTITRERNRLARELHDTLAHVQSGVAVQLEAVDTLWDTQPERARQLLHKSLASVRSGMSETRRALQALRASPLETHSLTEAIRQYATQKASHCRFDLTLTLPDTLPRLDWEVEQALYRIVGESLTNIEKHAGASQVGLRLNMTGGILELHIRDNGCGFVPEKVNGGARFGVRGLHEWAEVMGGTLQLRSQPGQGTEIHLKVALNNHD